MLRELIRQHLKILEVTELEGLSVGCCQAYVWD